MTSQKSKFLTGKFINNIQRIVIKKLLLGTGFKSITITDISYTACASVTCSASDKLVTFSHVLTNKLLLVSSFTVNKYRIYMQTKQSLSTVSP